MKNIKKISLVAHQLGSKKVNNKQDASVVKYLTEDGFLILPKIVIKEETWARLPETV